MRVEVEAVHQVTDELVDVAGRLLPQLSRSATPLDADGLARIVGHQAITSSSPAAEASSSAC
jgi:hypothetical protein